MMRRIGRPPEGRSRSVRVYRLCICEDWVPHEGQDACGEVVQRVRVISSATSTPSIWTSGRSRKMIIVFGWSLEKASKSEKMFNFVVYHIWHQQGCVTIRKCVNTLWLQHLLNVYPHITISFAVCVSFAGTGPPCSF